MSKEKNGKSSFEKTFEDWASERFEDVASWTKEVLDDEIEFSECQADQFSVSWELKWFLADAKLLRSAMDVPSIASSISKIKPKPKLVEEPNSSWFNYSWFYDYLWAKFWYDLIFGKKNVDYR
jgi:hypothetical protein